MKFCAIRSRETVSLSIITGSDGPSSSREGSGPCESIWICPWGAGEFLGQFVKSQSNPKPAEVLEAYRWLHLSFISKTAPVSSLAK